MGELLEEGLQLSSQALCSQTVLPLGRPDIYRHLPPRG